MTNTFYIFRHGLATKSKEGYSDTIVSANLLPEGIQQAKKIGEFLKGVFVNRFYSSEYPRCIQTADIISTILHAPYTKDKRLNEYYGIVFNDFVSQLKSFLSDVAKVDNQNILICTHVANIVALKKILFNETLEENDIYSNFPLPGVLQIIHGTTFKEIDFNTI